MRVLIDCRMAKWIGVGRYAHGLARALAARSDIELVQVCAAGEDPPVQPGFLVRAVTASAHPLSLRGAFELGSIVRVASPDVVHCLHFPTPMPQQAPLVVTLHDLTPLVIRGVMPSLAKRAAYRLWNARAVSAADAVVVPSHSTATDVARLFNSAGSKLRVITQAADDFASGPSGPLTGHLADLTSVPYLLSTGNVKPHKDLPTLLKAFAALDPLRTGTRLLLVGPDQPDYLQAELSDAPAELVDRVRFTGRVNDDELRALYSGAIAFVFPSRYEGFGMPPLEAMALGVPVISSNGASLAEVVGDAALTFAPGDIDALLEALRRVLRDSALRHQMAAAGRKRAAQVTWADVADATVAVYVDVLQHAEASRSGWEEDIGSDVSIGDKTE